MFARPDRPLAALVLVAIAAAGWPAAAAAQDVTVTVNGAPLYLNPGPIERSGRVFVPLRGIFERLGASVVYNAGTINATKGSATISLHVGSAQAVVNGQTQFLDVAPFIVGATAYVPLRFIAQSLGANVGYDNATRVVSIVVAQAAPPVPPRPPPPRPAPPVHLRAQQPPPDSQTGDRFALISAGFTRNVEAGSVRVSLDGANVTYRSGISPSAFSYKPPAPLDYGTHTVRVRGRAPGGVAFDRSWSFAVVRSGPARLHLTIYQPAPNAPVGRTFTVAGNTVAGARVRITAGPSPQSTGQFAGTVLAGPRGNFSLKVTITPLMGQQAVTMRITASDPASGRATQRVLQLRYNG